MNKLNVIISKATNERDILAYLKREIKIAESNEFYEPYDFINDLLLTLSKLEQTENYSFERELNQLKDKTSKNVITYHINHDYYTFCIDRNENRSFDDYLQEQYPIRESHLQSEIQRLTDRHKKIISHYKSVEIAINELTTQFEPEPNQLPKHFTKTLTTEQRNYLYRKLTEKGVFLPIDTDFESFCFVFGVDVKPNHFEPLKWQQNKQLLRELLEPLQHPDIKIKADFERNVSDYFIDKNNNVIVLSKNKVVESTLHDNLLTIIKRLTSPDKVLATL